MQHRTVFEVMPHDVVTAAPETPFKQIARLFADHDVSAVPVVDADRRLLGVVSEADLLRATAELPDLEGRWAGVRLLSQERGLPDAETAAQPMTSSAVTARANWNLVETARTMHRKGVKGLPVADETGRVVGIVSRSDLLRPFLRLAPDTIRVTVDDGVVRLTGRVDERADIRVTTRLCRSGDGVVALHESIEYAYDNLALDVEPPR
ncbi:CBS domain-containing protein [Streptomyces sp. NBC_01268]|uniref:CBS domain-containing protein n=1 Tax=Streptomyces sp. NBC_01268 TaxID=2903806 RepID=UPI002E339665|nr:CBS domain-containing protein [Streptomyces sp. NBC_01268]